ncbi:MAG: MFS transporter [Chloroflexia bacterium]|nr:MFS transporter [Chloroflexia bacterium]
MVAPPPATAPRDETGRPISWRRTLYALWIAQTLAIMGFSLRAPFLPFFLDDLGTNSVESQALWSGVINAGGAGVMALSAPFWGVIADRYGRKPMVLRSMFAAMVTISLMGLATSPWHLLGLRFVEGAFTGTVTASTALVASTAPRERTGFALGLIQTAVFSGASLGPLIGGVLAAQIGYRATFGVAGAMLAVAGLIVVFLVQERFVPVPRGNGATGRFRGTFDLLAGRIMLMMVLSMLVIRLAGSSIQPILPLFVGQVSGGTPGEQAALAGLILGVAGLTSAISSVVLGRLGDRVGHRPILFWSALCGGLLYLPMVIVDAPWQLAVLQGLFGVAAGGLIPSANALVVASTAPERRGVVFGLMAGSASLGGFIGPLAGSGIAAGFGFGVAFLATGLSLLLLALALYLVVIASPSTATRQPVRT